MREYAQMEQWLRGAKNGEPVWLADVREACGDMEPARPVVVQLTVPDGNVRDFRFDLPIWNIPEERALAAEYVRACVFNILSVHSGRRMVLYRDGGDGELCALLDELPRAFQIDAARRTGCGKAISIADRLCRSVGAVRFAFSFRDMSAYVPAAPTTVREPVLENMLRRAAERAAAGLLCGVDVGGTDVKLALARDGRLIGVRVLDWDPAAGTTAEDTLGPLLGFIGAALEELAPGEKLDGLGVSYPDVVIRDRIVGGETPKTRGMRLHAADYEAEFARITALRDRLEILCVPGAPIRIVNDGHMAAFTAAMELVYCGRGGELAGGVVANALGTDLGTGWLEPDGTVPEAPMELYDLLLDMGSYPDRALPPEDLRSVRNENSGMPGIRRYVGQSAAFRLAWQMKPALLDGFTVCQGDALMLREAPDMRKPCLAHLIAAARDGDAAAREVFRQIGRHLGQMYREMQWLLQPSTDVRFLFGRFVMEPACFELIRAGCAETAPWIRLEAADEGMAHSPLMRQLAAWPGVTVAQFGQAVGAICFCCM